MSVKPRHGRTLCVLIGAQALALVAIAQEPPGTTQPLDERSRESVEERAQDQEQMETQRERSAQMDHSKMKPVTAQSFASQAAVIGNAEVELAQLALKNTKNEQIRMYAERIVKDHTAANRKLQKIAAEENLDLPQSLDAEHRAVKEKLSSLQGDAFDREYKKHMITGHDEAVALFESASQTEQMPEDLQEFAASTLPTLQKHKAMAKSLEADEGA